MEPGRGFEEAFNGADWIFDTVKADRAQPEAQSPPNDVAVAVSTPNSSDQVVAKEHSLLPMTADTRPVDAPPPLVSWLATETPSSPEMPEAATKNNETVDVRVPSGEPFVNLLMSLPLCS